MILGKKSFITKPPVSNCVEECLHDVNYIRTKTDCKVKNVQELRISIHKGMIIVKTYQIHLIRHGLTDGNTQGRYIGRTDLPLSGRGDPGIERPG